MNKNKKAFGGVASTLIMFIAIVTLTAGLVIAFMSYMRTTEDSFSVQNKITSNRLKTAVSISHIYYNETSKELFVYLKNIGDTKLKTKLFDLFVDDLYYDNFSIYYANNLSEKMVYLNPYVTCVVKKDIDLGLGTHSVVVNTEYGVSNEDSFNI